MKDAKKPAFHGSDLEKIEACYHIPKEEIVSFGANVNPLGLSESVRQKLCGHLDVITRYPDREYKSLLRTAAAYCEARPEYLIAGSGSTELIRLLITAKRSRHALVLGPTYSEYERELALNNGKISFYNLKEEERFHLDVEDFLASLPVDTDLVILCNPNNPTSSALTQEELSILLGAFKERGIFAMIDETYAEFAPESAHISAIPLAEDFDNFLVLRGVSKFFAAPGLRFGYGVTSDLALLRALRRIQDPWSLNSVGAFAWELLVQDTDYIRRTRELIASERKRIYETVRSFSFARPYEPFANFILVRILKEDLTSFQVFEHAIRQKLMIRDCSSFSSLPGEYIRFCVMNPKDNSRLLACLKEVLD